MKISVVIPTYNDKDALDDCLTSLKLQSEKNTEIIIVDDGSTDKTPDVLSKFSGLRILKCKHKGAGAARNIGAAAAKGKILVFVDADMTFAEDFIQKLTAPINSGASKGTFSRDEMVSNWGNIWARCWNINEGWQEGRRHPKNFPDHQPVFRAILKSEFEKVGGFTPGGYDDDWSLSKKLGYEATLSPGAVFYHKNPSSLSEVFKHAKWVGKRKYKMGLIGYLVALVRASIPFSIVIGLYKSLIFKNLHFLTFKIVYDWGIFTGIPELLFLGKSAK